MRHRTKTHLLTKEQIDELLLKAEVGRLGTISEDGLPMHFVYFDNKICMHGLPKGKKIDNIKFNSNVCFEVDEMIGLLYE
ncbi:pyridoxamine 5'-phosphate oxidase family protein [Aliarcobacter butzleri]|nr:pyridoxamine 5'-phosphate oxidase family protein [Aliarcobacter butzleri]MCT7646111.1 pyridoxamine 5'-phosphate oxidase family protein [Aliarcobacter butzleri]